MKKETNNEVVEEVKQEESLQPVAEASSGKKKRRKLVECLPGDDIKFRGPLTYQTLRIIGWVFLALAQVSAILSIFVKIDSSLEQPLQIPQSIFSFFSNFPLSLFILANFAFIFQKKNNYKHMLIFYGGIALGLYTAAVLLTSHFFATPLMILSPELGFGNVSVVIGTLLAGVGGSAYSLNMFIDLFLCSLTFFFLHYSPKKLFQGKKIILFRLMVLIPVIYELGAIFIKYFTFLEELTISYFLFFLLPAKPPLMFVAFLIIALVMKLQDILYMRKFNSKQRLEKYRTTNADSLKISVTISWTFLVCAIIDFGIVLLFGIRYMYKFPEAGDNAILAGMIAALSTGFGNATSLVFAIPFAMLFSYSRKPKNEKINKYVPILGIGLIVLVYVEGLFLVLLHLLPKLREAFTIPDEEGEGASMILHLVDNIKQAYILYR